MDITHTVDGCRYYCVSRTIAAEAQRQEQEIEDLREETETDYAEYMTGGTATAGYIGF